MKRTLTLVLLSIATCVNAQWKNQNVISFEGADSFYRSLIIIDTSYHNNKWQIGKPNKTYFTSACSGQRAIVTDTLNPYPAADTSVFILKMPAKINLFAPSYINPVISLDFFYQLKKDTNTIAKVEVSIDSGNHWYDTKDTLLPFFRWQPGTHAIDTTTAWTHFYLMTPGTSHPLVDTQFFRFTLISNSAAAPADGWIIDSITLYYAAESVPQIENKNLISLYPNPSAGNIYINVDGPTSKNGIIAIYDLYGQEVYKADKLPADGHLKLPSIPNGSYILRYVTTDEYCVKRIVVER